MRVAFVRRFLVSVLIPILLCAGAALDTAAAQQVPPQQQQETVPSYRARVLGVYDEVSGAPIEGAKISDMASGSSSLTTSTGTVSLVFLPDGGGLIQVQKIGYESKMIPVTISPSDTTALTVVMRPLAAGSATRLPGVTTTAAAPYISPALRGFEERRTKGGSGYFVDDTTLRRNDSHQLADVMRRLPSVNFGRGQGRGVFLLSSPSCSSSISTHPPGPPQVFLDGVPLTSDPPPPSSSRRGSPSTLTPFDLSQFQVSNLAGVEWYPSTSTAPIQYAGTSERCGVLLLWTRER